MCTKTSSLHRVHKNMAGFSLVEIMIATLLIALILIPALSALQSGIQGSSIHTSRAVAYYRMKGKMEDVLSKSFIELEEEADATGSSTVIVNSYSDGTFFSSDARCLVYLSRFDADNADADNNPFTDTDAGVIWVKVQIENSNDSLETLIIE